MPIEIIIISIILTGLLVGSYTDLKTREVPDWLSYGLIFTGLGLRLLFSTITLDKSIFIEGFVGFIIFVGIGYMMYYTGQWGGGDSKLLMGLGALIGLNFHYAAKSSLVFFFVSILLAGAVYGAGWIVYLAIKHRIQVVKEVKQLTEKTAHYRNGVLILTLVLLTISGFTLNKISPDRFLFISFVGLAISPTVIFYLWRMTKAIENVALFKEVEPVQLTEGDWIAQDIIVEGRRITGPSDLGITSNNIQKLKGYYHQGKIGKIIIKEGIPFVPSFLIGFIATLFLEDWFRRLI